MAPFARRRATLLTLALLLSSTARARAQPRGDPCTVARLVGLVDLCAPRDTADASAPSPGDDACCAELRALNDARCFCREPFLTLPQPQQSALVPALANGPRRCGVNTRVGDRCLSVVRPEPRPPPAPLSPTQPRPQPVPVPVLVPPPPGEMLSPSQSPGATTSPSLSPSPSPSPAPSPAPPRNSCAASELVRFVQDGCAATLAAASEDGALASCCDRLRAFNDAACFCLDETAPTLRAFPANFRRAFGAAPARCGLVVRGGWQCAPFPAEAAWTRGEGRHRGRRRDDRSLRRRRILRILRFPRPPRILRLPRLPRILRFPRPAPRPRTNPRRSPISTRSTRWCVDPRRWCHLRNRGAIGSRSRRSRRPRRATRVANASVCSTRRCVSAIRSWRRSSVNAERDSRGRSWRRRWRAGSRCTPGSTTTGFAVTRPGTRRPGTRRPGTRQPGTRRRAEPCVPSNRRLRRLRRRFRHDRRVRRVPARRRRRRRRRPKRPKRPRDLGVRLDLPVATRRGCGRRAGLFRARRVRRGFARVAGTSGDGNTSGRGGRARTMCFRGNLARRRVSRA